MLLGAMLCAVAVEAQQVIVDKIVAVVGNSAIYYSDVIATAERLTQQRREMGYTSDRDPQNEALEQLMLQKLLYHQGQIDSVSVNEGDILSRVEDQVQAMIADAGSISELEAVYHMPIFNIREMLHRQMEEQAYSQSMQNAEAQSPSRQYLTQIQYRLAT